MRYSCDPLMISKVARPITMEPTKIVITISLKEGHVAEASAMTIPSETMVRSADMESPLVFFVNAQVTPAGKYACHEFTWMHRSPKNENDKDHKCGEENDDNQPEPRIGFMFSWMLHNPSFRVKATY